MYGHVLVQMLQDVPLDGTATVDHGPHLAVHLVPGAANLALEVTREGAEIFVKGLGVAVARLHGENRRVALVTEFSAVAAARHTARRTGSLHQDFGHVGTHRRS